MSVLQGFAPLVGDAPRVLIVGSMPSVASLENLQYYGKPQNAFWRIMGELFAAGPDLDYTTRAKRLTLAGVAVWDVVARCHRPGSLDSAIDMSSVQVNDFAAFLQEHASLHTVFFNGRKAGEIWRRFVQSDVAAVRSALPYHALPSTSPAMATLNFAGKLARWRIVKEKARS